jgi:hypothetical protein
MPRGIEAGDGIIAPKPTGTAAAPRNDETLRNPEENPPVVLALETESPV